MSREIIGNSYIYIVDESYGINHDGFIAIGTESIVYKGLKTKRGGGLQFSCVLKFKPKRQIVDGVLIDNLASFKNEEWPIFQELRECRSVVRIDDVIDDLKDFSLPCSHIQGGVIDSSAYFCVVEEYVDGWNLDEFCREEFWKLRKIEALPNGMKEKVEFRKFTDEAKSAVLAAYNYDNQLKFQNQIMLFMINLCEIMEYVTEQKNILHLDIKPENIMVTRYGKELVLIDFGRSKQITDADRFAVNEMTAVDYSKPETQEKQYQYGTLGYAAPECYCEAATEVPAPVKHVSERGKMSIESDIFSFGATFWECLNLFELVTKTGDEVQDLYDFYQKYLLKEAAYCNRDLSLTNTTYHQKLDQIIRKCTRSRKDDFRTSDKYYHSYKDLKRDIEIAKDSTPTIVKEENVKVRSAFKLGAALCAVALVFAAANGVYHSRSYQIAENKWNTLVSSSYNDTQFNRLSTIARDYVAAAPAGSVDATYSKIEGFTYENGGSITSYEAAMLVELLEQINNKALLPGRVDTIMKNAEPGSYREISAQLVNLELEGESVGYELAKAIYNVEVAKKKEEIPAAFQVLQEYMHEDDFRNAVVKLKNTLDNDDCIALLEEPTGMTRQELLDFFAQID